MCFSKIQISTETKGDVWCPIPRDSLQLLVSLLLLGKMSAGHIRAEVTTVVYMYFKSTVMYMYRTVQTCNLRCEYCGRNKPACTCRASS